MAYGFYIASVCGALAVWLVLPSDRRKPIMLGVIAGAATLGGLLLHTASLAYDAEQGTPSLYYYIFTVLAVLSAVRVISHPRPVYSALYFVMVVLSVAGMFLTLEAEFMAFAMIIIYAGAILVTYLFVIMLASLPPSAYESHEAPAYDRVAREPFLACFVGFALLAVLSSIIFSSVDPITPRPERDAVTVAIEQMPDRITPVLLAQNAINIDTNHPDLTYRMEEGALIASIGIGADERIELTSDLREAIANSIGNIDRVGLNLFESHTLGIELAGVILLVSMVGAIVIAKRKVTGGNEASRHEGTEAEVI